MATNKVKLFTILILIVFVGDVLSQEQEIVIDKPVGEFANNITTIFFAGLSTVLKDSVFYRFSVALAIFCVFWYVGRMYFQWQSGDIESSFKFLLSNGMMVFVVAYLSIGAVYMDALATYVKFIHAIGNSIQLAFIGTSDISASAEYIEKIMSSVIFDDSDLSWYEQISIGFNLAIMWALVWLLIALAHFHSLFADIFIYVLSVVGPICIPLVLVQRLDKVFDGWVNGMISSFFYFVFVKIILSITVMIVGLGYLSMPAYLDFIIDGQISLEPHVVHVADASDVAKPMLFFFVALMAMFNIRSFVATMVGSSGMSGLAGGGAGMGMLRMGNKKLRS